MRKVILMSLVLAPFTIVSAQAADAVMGKRQFAPCTACHTVEKDGPNKVGPNLHGIFGAKAGTLRKDFTYSEAMKNSGITWDDAKLDAYLKKPAEAIPGNKMAFIGMPKDEVRANVIAYMKEATK